MRTGAARRWAIVATAVFTLFATFGSNSEALAAPKKFAWTTQSEEAKQLVANIVNQIESFSATPATLEQAKKIVALDPNFAFGHYLVATFSNSPQEGQPHAAKAVELAKNASEGERDYINAVLLVRQQKYAEALPLLEQVTTKYPDERMGWMMTGQLQQAAGRPDKARAAFDRAAKIDGSTPRVFTFLGNMDLLDGDYNKARQMYMKSSSKAAAGTVPFGARFAYATTFVYEGKMDEAIKALESLRVDYLKAGNDANFPEVFIHNAIARVYLESGNPAKAIEEYNKGYESVKRSTVAALDETQRTIWFGRLHHGTGRALAKLGKHEEAWKLAETIKGMIEKGGEQGQQFWPAYHYMAGYLKLEAGDFAAAVKHLEQADKNDPFHQLLLARAYERSGDKANADKTYHAILASTALGLERALAVPEAKKHVGGKSQGKV